MKPIRLPAYSPELNPAEQVFRCLRQVLANRIFDTVEELEEALTAALQPLWENPSRLQRLTAYPWWSKEATPLPSPSP